MLRRKWQNALREEKMENKGAAGKYLSASTKDTRTYKHGLPRRAGKRLDQKGRRDYISWRQRFERPTKQ